MRTNKWVAIGSIVFCIFLNLQYTFAQSKNPATDSLQKQLQRLVRSTDPKDRELLNTKLSQLAASNNEPDMLMAANYYYNIKNAKASDSLINLAVNKFPEGIQARYAGQKVVFDLKTPEEKEAAYYKWIAKFPPQKFLTGDIADGVVYDYVIADIAVGYAKEKKDNKAIAMINQLHADFWKGNAYGGLSDSFYKNGDLVHAEEYARKAMESAESFTDGKKGNSNAAKFAAFGYPGLASSYANILAEEKKYNEALKYFAIAEKNSTELNVRLNERYAKTLMEINRNQEAFDKLQAIVKAGKATPEVADNFKKLYIKLKGSEAGFDAYAAQIHRGYLDDLKKRLNKDIIKQPAAMFTLTDLNGRQVSLASLKGKTVILDFWATWCGPCKASFPAMQEAVNKYNDDPSVKFLFIHTWEKSATPVDDARAYVSGMKYNFEVLMDTKDPETKVNKVVSSYGVNGIPAKFVIDGNGNIRFKLTGFDGSKEAAVEELSMMIDMTKTK